MTRIPRRPSPRSGATGSAVALLLVLGVLGACSASGGDSAKGPATISPETTTTQGTATGAAGRAGCGEVEPGVAVDRAQAVVYFDTQSVCPGWVTVAQGTQVTFANDGTAPATVAITATQLPDSAEMARFVVPPGGTQVFATVDVAMLGFSTDALPGFRGTIEVVGPNGEMQH